MNIALSPRRTRGQRRKIDTVPKETPEDEASPEDGQMVSEMSSLAIHVPVSSMSRTYLESSIKLLPQKLKASDVELSSSDVKILLKKQKWLRTYNIALPDGDAALQNIIDATVVFGQEEAGTAVCISTKGHLLTCSHCVAETEDELDLQRLHCLLFASGTAVRARCIAWDCKRDLALLQVVAAQELNTSSFPALSVASTPPKLRDQLVCVGHPGSEDLESSLPGVKTNYDTLYASTGTFRGHAKGQDLQDNSEIGALKHDCWTYWGHSGAPLVHRRTGELVGLHSSWDDTTGMRRGVPLEAIQAFVEEHGLCLTDE